MTEIVGIRFRGMGKTYFFDPCGEKFREGDRVVVETASGTELGEVAAANQFVDDEKIVPPFRKVLRPAGEDDLAEAEVRREEEQAAKLYCQERADARGLDMRVISAERSLDGTKMVFSFVSENRVDFRELVRDLVSQYHTRIELRQVGVRDKAKMLGGIGVCGRPFCCSQFLKDFHPVSIKMAKDQSLSLSPTKISGSCGRLMCCLKYEQEAYSELLKTTPKLGSLVRTADGDGAITAISLLRRQVRVLLEKDTEFSAKYYPIDDIEILRSGKAHSKPAVREEDDVYSDAEAVPAPRRTPRPERTERSDRGSRNEQRASAASSAEAEEPDAENEDAGDDIPMPTDMEAPAERRRPHRRGGRGGRGHRSGGRPQPSGGAPEA